MNGTRVLTKVAGVGLMVGFAGVLTSQAAHADDTLLGPLAGSDTAIILGGTTEPMPSTAFAQTAENLYLHALGFDGGATSSTVCDMIATDPCSAPLQVLTTPELIQQGPSSLTAADDVVLAVENEFERQSRRFRRRPPADDLRILAKRHRRVDRHDPTWRPMASPKRICTSCSSATRPWRTPAHGPIWSPTSTGYSARA